MGIAEAEREAAAYPAAHAMTYRPEVDGLRAIAVSAVIVYHAGLPFLTGGYAGVDVFFVISGYLIGAIILNDVAHGRFSFIDFYERRVRRIFPAMGAMLVAATIAAWLLTSPHQLRDFGQAELATMVFLANFYFRIKTGYFSEDTEYNPLIHMWSLAVEEQFYLLFPLGILMLKRFPRRWTVAAVAAAAALSFAWCIRGALTDPLGNFFATPPRAWELLAGVLVALIRPSTPSREGAGTNAIEVVAVLAIAAPLALATSHTAWPGPATLPVVLGTAALLWASSERTPVGRLLAAKPVVAVGLVSYSAYLWHQPLFAFARLSIPHALRGPEIALLIGATFAVAWLSWRFIERPFRSRRRVSRRTVLFLAFGLPAVFGALGYGLHISQGVPQRYPLAARRLAATAEPSPYRTTCHAEGLAYRHPAQACRYLGKGPTTWAVLGDSHGIELAYALSERLHVKGETLAHLTFSGCPPAYTFESDNPGCSAWTREAVDWLAARHSITHVLIVYRAPYHLYGDQLETYPRLPDSHPRFLQSRTTAEARSAYWASFTAMVSRLRAAGKQLVIVRPVPELPMQAERYAYRPPADGSLGMQRAYVDARALAVNDRLDALATQDPGILLIDPRSALCDSRACVSIIGRQLLYFDDDHLSLAGARRVVAMAARDRSLP